MQQNTIIKGRDNPVRMSFTFSGDFAEQGLNSFTRVEIKLGDSVYSETYDTVANPTLLKILNSGTTLELSIGDTTNLAVGSYTPQIIGYSNVYDDGYELTGNCKRVLGKIKVVDCT